MELIKSTGINPSGLNAVVIGRSNIVGLPVAALLQEADATVTVCHSKTKDLKTIASIMLKQVSRADLVVAAVGSPQLVKGSWLKPGAVVIDVGTNAIADSSKRSGTRWYAWV